MNILILHGPNLNLLGKRQPDIYGSESLDELSTWIQTSPEAVNMNLKFFQSNHEGEIIDCLQDEREWSEGIIINPGAFAHYSYAIRDAIEAIGIPTVEVHISNINNREKFRQLLVISDVCINTITGKGKSGYLKALTFLQNI